MLRFFRQIRQRLLNENRFSKYLLYAIGEILLVVIGILIALQVDTWNEQRKDSQEEKRILVDLKKEFQGNLKTIEKMIFEKERIISICSLFLKSAGEKAVWDQPYNFDSLLVKTVVSGWKFNPEDGVLVELINSGKLDLIENEKLRYLISALPGQLNNLHHEDAMVINDLHNTYLPFLTQEYPIRNTNLYESGQLSKSRRARMKELGPSSFDSSAESLLRNPEFENNINIQLLWVNFSLTFYESVRDIYVNAIELIKNELNRLKN